MLWNLFNEKEYIERDFLVDNRLKGEKGLFWWICDVSPEAAQSFDDSGQYLEKRDGGFESNRIGIFVEVRLFG